MFPSLSKLKKHCLLTNTEELAPKKLEFGGDAQVVIPIISLNGSASEP